MPLIFGDLVQRDNEYWHLLMLLLQIVNIVFSPILTTGMTIFLKHIIIDHHQLFKHLFPTRNLLPKHHFMIHYPRCIRNIGPLLHMWCVMRQSITFSKLNSKVSKISPRLWPENTRNTWPCTGNLSASAE